MSPVYNHMSMVSRGRLTVHYLDELTQAGAQVGYHTRACVGAVIIQTAHPRMKGVSFAMAEVNVNGGGRYSRKGEGR